MANSRNLIVLFDGTWNTPTNKDGTVEASSNVAKFSSTLAACGGMQRQHYEEGVGTDFQERLGGGALGMGIKALVLRGYSFLQEMYADPDFKREDNKVFIFGFSRGAYTARLLGHLIDWTGIPKESRDCEEGVSLFLDGKGAGAQKGSGRFFEVRVEMVGVWDTVKTAAIRDYRDAKLPKAVVAGYHAMALDEKRALFPVLRWKGAKDRAKEMWFAGVHSNVGGGYADSGLSDIALRWMIDSAREHGLKFKRNEVEKFMPNPLGQQRDSFKEASLPGKKPRRIRNGDLIHQSVEKRMAAGIGYKPVANNWPSNPCYEV
jgi:uncharacterized protein (DUF2235 family)